MKDDRVSKVIVIDYIYFCNIILKDDLVSKVIVIDYSAKSSVIATEASTRVNWGRSQASWPLKTAIHHRPSLISRILFIILTVRSCGIFFVILLLLLHRLLKPQLTMPGLIFLLHRLLKPQLTLPGLVFLLLLHRLLKPQLPLPGLI